jgi:D-alanine-D-alanine ligase
MHAKELTGPGCEAVLDELAAALGFPIFVKPANMGSSIGVSKVTTRAEFRAAVDDALR